MDPKIASFFKKLSGNKLEVALALRDIFKTYCPPLSESIKWNNLTFSLDKDHLVFVYAYKTTAYVNLGFLKATELKDKENLFEGTGVAMRHIKIQKVTDIPEKQIRKWIQESISISKKRVN